MPSFERACVLAAPAQQLWDWHARPAAFERLTPPWESVRVLEPLAALHDGARTTLRVGSAPLARRWVAEIHDCLQGLRFRDRQVSGPLRRWEHMHAFEPLGDDTARMVDLVEYELQPWQRAALPVVRRRLARAFAWRHARLARDFALIYRHPSPPLRVLVSGSTGLIGSDLVTFLRAAGHEVIRLVRGKVRPGDRAIGWNPERGEIDPATLEDFDAVVHLAGAPIFGRFSDAHKRRVMDSRRDGTGLLARTLAGLTRPPRVLVSASAMGWYGRGAGDRWLEEDAPAGEGFMAEVCKVWEAGTAPAAEAGIRVVNTRFAVVLSPAGGALRMMLPTFSAGVAGPLGDGSMWMSWVSLDDAVGAIWAAITTTGLAGPVNVGAPNPVTNREYTRTLAKVLRRPALIPAPTPVLKMVLGREMVDEALLASIRMHPRRLEQAGYQFLDPALEPALRLMLGREG